MGKGYEGKTIVRQIKIGFIKDIVACIIYALHDIMVNRGLNKNIDRLWEEYSLFKNLLYKTRSEDLKDKIMEELDRKNIEMFEDEPMKNHTTFKIGGPADLFVIPENEEELIDTIKIARRFNYPFMILGNGSNMLVRDTGIRGMVIKLRDNFNLIEFEGNRLICKPGALLADISKLAQKEGLTGMEFASGIPGALGGALTMNAGAYGGEMRDIVKNVKVLDSKNKVIYIDGPELELEYRTSRVKKEGLVVLEAELELECGDKSEIQIKMDDLNDRRASKQPLEWPSGGSTFKRPEGYYAGKLIDDAGLRGIRYRDAQVSEKHCGFIINRGNASYKDVMTLIGTVQKVVRDKFGVELEREIMVIGDDVDEINR